MRDFIFKIDGRINMAALDRALRQRFGARCAGITLDGDQLRVHLDDDAGDQEQAEAAAIVAGHNPDDLTPEQERDQLDREAGRTLIANLNEQIDWHEQNKPTDARSALEVVQRMQTEWVALLRLLRAQGTFLILGESSPDGSGR